MNDTSALNIHTRSDQEEVLREIDILLDSIYRKDGLDTALEGKIRHSTAAAIKTLIKEGDPDDILKKLKEDIKSLPSIEIVLAYEPGEAFLAKVNEILSEKIGQDVILDIHYDKSLLGGAQIIHNGYYYDYTLKKILETKLADRRSDAS